MTESDQSAAAAGRPKVATERAIVLLGAPGAGKGTQALTLAQRLKVPHLSTGDMFREHVARGDELGRRAKAIMEAGELVPDELVTAMLAHRLQQGDCAGGCILDGYPRTLGQAQALDQMLGGGRRGPIVINLRIEYNELIQRLTGRRSCPKCGQIYNLYLKPPASEGLCDADHTPLIQRTDDNEQVVRERMAAYEASTRPVVDYYRGRETFFEVDGSGTPEEIAAALFQVLGRAGTQAEA